MKFLTTTYYTQNSCHTTSVEEILVTVNMFTDNCAIIKVCDLSPETSGCI